MMPDTRYRLTGLHHDDGKLRCQLTVPADSPYFEGHFPGNPIVPGVAQVQMLSEALTVVLGHEVQWRALEQVRFRRPIQPDVACQLEVDIDHGCDRVTFRLADAGGLTTDGALTLAHAKESHAH